MKLILPKLTAALLVALSGTSLAATFSYDGNTLGSSTFHRPSGDEYPSAPTEASLSSIGTEWSYQLTTFTVDVTGAYDFQLTSDTFDIYLALYTSFDGLAPTSNLIALLDGDDASSSSLYETTLNGITLTAGTSYSLVVTSFWDNTNGDLNGNTPSGAFLGSISGPGNIAAVPEPAVSLLGAIGALSLFRRRRVA